MNIVCASSVTYGREAFAPLGALSWVPETEIGPAEVRAAEALITRTKTRLDAALLKGSRVRFAGTCTAGTDHANLAELAALGVHFASAPGCNANAVSEYVVAALLEAHASTGFRFSGKTIGIVGCGEVGSRVARKAAALGMRVLRNDPPKEAAGAAGPWTPLRELLEACDVLTLHVPLVEDGEHPTRRLLGAEEIVLLPRGAIVLNACRGEVVDGTALASARRRGDLSWLVLDVWDPEPRIPEDLLAAADLASAHIAGHSVEGKVNGTRQIREAFCAWAGIDDGGWDPRPLLPPPLHAEIHLPDLPGFEERLRFAVRACYDIRMDDALLRASTPDRAKLFNHLRRGYRDRREFDATFVTGLRAEEKPIYAALGFGSGNRAA
jgi:erythronate-4-phosphate dehydrogenase